MNKQNNICPNCNTDLSYEVDGKTYSKITGVEYAYGHPARYDGVSEWFYPCCEHRVGRWTGRTLEGPHDYEERYGGK